MDYQPSDISARELKATYVGTLVEALSTPSFIIDKGIFERNCAAMMKNAHEWGATFRAHLKTHKTVEGTKRQLRTREGKTGAIAVSTVKEAWEVWNAGLVKDGTVNDILYALPIGANKIAALARLWDGVENRGGIVRLLVDHPAQIDLLERFENSRERPRRWSVFVKVDSGHNRSGVPPTSDALGSLISAILASQAVGLAGFYVHAGNSYASTSRSEATGFLSAELQCANDAAAYTLSHFSELLKRTGHTKPFVLSIGSTPTALASGIDTKELLQRQLHGRLEIHAGNYPILDLQQQHTGLIDYPRIAHRVRVSVISYYPGRGKDGSDEALIDAGAIAFSKDTGPSGTYGEVVGKPWVLTRMSQEHGILTCIDKSHPASKLEIGDVIDIIGQHACLIAAAHPWYYVVDSKVDGAKTIFDVWKPWKGW